MSHVAAESCTAVGAVDQTFESYAVREVSVGPITVQRALPLRGRRLIGPWCFLDRFGPLTFSAGTPKRCGAASTHGPADRHLAARWRACPSR
jgi:hypothetical protein